MSNRILYISQEITPYLAANRMSTIGQKLPQHAQENGYEVRIFMPKYGAINERRNQLHEVIRLSGLNVIIDDTDHPLIIKVATLQPSRMQVYFIDSDDYFIHKTINDLELNLYPAENDERMMFFAYGVIETVKKLRWEPRIVHCQGWVSSLAPLYIKTLYADDPTFKNARVICSLYNDRFDGALDSRFIDKLAESGIPAEVVDKLKGKDITYTDLMKLAIDYSDAIAISSPEIPQELIDYAHASGKPVVEYPGSDDNFAPYVEAYNDMLK
ncbi:MAG: glycogen/starch synthase [Muribaculaceae bacterium]|nr:glycogen/starch synthase [Muribaculaceae bacterium]